MPTTTSMLRPPSLNGPGMAARLTAPIVQLASKLRIRLALLFALGMLQGIALGALLREPTAGLGWLALALAGLLAGWVIGEWSVIRRMHALLSTATQMAEGRVKACSDMPYGLDELNQLAKAFDNLASTLQIEQAEARLAEESQHEAEHRYAALTEEVADPIITLDRQGHIQSINRAVELVSGYDAPELLGEPLVGMPILTDASMAQAQQEFACIIDGQARLPFEVALVRKDGVHVAFEAYPHPIKRGDQIVGMHLVFRNIGERKRIDAVLKETNTKLEDALARLKASQEQVVERERLRALGQMASGIAHDFNNALAPILGFSELLLDHPEKMEDRDKLIKYLQMIQTSAKDAAVVVRRLREFYRSRGSSEVFARVDLNQLIQQVISLTEPRWKTQSLANGVTIRVSTDLQDVLPIMGNETELREVLTNLIFNAVDAMPNGGVVLLRTKAEDEHVVLEVHDTGTGMTDEVRKRCLEPFFTTKGEQGTGLGLSMVYGIIRRHGGALHIETEPGAGTTIIMLLPVGKDAAGGESGAAPASVETAAVRSLYILVVEDEPMVREVTVEHLVTDGHTVETATNGREGLVKFYGGWFDVVITDRAMPEMNGDRLAVAIKQIAPKKPVILLSGFGDMMEASAEKPPGVDLVLSKPVTAETLRQALSWVISL